MCICARLHSAVQLLEREMIIYLDLLSDTCLQAVQTLEPVRRKEKFKVGLRKKNPTNYIRLYTTEVCVHVFVVWGFFNLMARGGEDDVLFWNKGFLFTGY